MSKGLESRKSRLLYNGERTKRGIPTAWIVGLPEEEHEAFDQSWRNSTYVLDRLKMIIERELTSLELDQDDEYNNPQWPVLRADKNGRARALKNIYKLLP